VDFAPETAPASPLNRFREGSRYGAPKTGFDCDPSQWSPMARKTILVCDNCGKEVQEGQGAVMRVNFEDARRGAKQADLCEACATSLPGRPVARRGRRPRAA
jgi:hypothetical protein